MSGAAVTLDGHRVLLTHTDKVLFPCGLTKGDLIRYYRRIAPFALAHYRGRPLTMERYPDGIDQPGFFQKHMPPYFPDWIDRVELPMQGGTVIHVVANSAASLAYLANQGCITPHLALACADRPDHPDRIVIDLDPSDGDFAKVQETATHVRRALDRRGITSFVQTTGSRGLHVVIALDGCSPFEDVRTWLRTFAREVVAADPALMTLAMRKAERGGRVLLDLARNAYGQTAVAPYAVRARDGAPVATPLRWEEALASDMHPRRYTIRTIFRRLARIVDPWAELFDAACPLGSFGP